jgi:transcriptional regulator with PAS, ATPase and Fis domain
MSRQCHTILKYPNQPTYNVPLDKIINPTKTENGYFWGILKSDRAITDESVTMLVNKEIISCNMTISRFESSEGIWSGKIIVIEAIERINKLIRSYTGNRARLSFNDIVGSNSDFLIAVKKSRISASSISNILLLGESGTGKDVLAQAIHNESPRRTGPFIAINCAALPRELIASELFGYDEGAYTGAKRGGNMGKFELAHQGTIFLDEIGDMPVDLQAILLRVIEEKNVLRLGGNKHIAVNVRIIAATNKNLEAEIERNTFRRDLYYRLGVIRIIIPALRDRIDDIPELSQHFIHVLCKRLNLPAKTLSPEVMEIFQSYHWPGNVRELQNVLENAVQWSPDLVINKDLIEPLLSTLTPHTDLERESHHEIISEKNIILSYLKSFDYNKSKTAKALGISRKTLYVKLREYNIPFEP